MRSLHRPSALRAASASIVVAVAVLLAACGDGPERERGRRLFAGELPAAGHIKGHTETLPSDASRCANCHTARGAAASAPTSAFGPALSRATLLASLSRRGGPPSRFDEAKLCRLLRTGIDPVSIVVAQSMPLYDLSDDDCHALWTYLTQAD